MSEHFCTYHQQLEPLSNFRLTKYGKPSSWCIEGTREYNRAYSRAHYQPKPTSTHKACSGCGVVLLVEEFPPRGDRPGKYYARCYSCRSKQVKTSNIRQTSLYPEKLKAKRKKYQQTHPGYGGGKQRKLALAKVKREPYDLNDIWGEGVCFFCQGILDRSIKWPDPQSVSIHHVHPLAKKGPDIAKNVVISHLFCNQSNRDKYINPFQNYRVDPLDSHLLREIAQEYHYLKRKPNVSWGFGLYCQNELLGIASFGSPSSYRISRSACPDQPKLVVEWNRLWINDKVPFGAASWFGARALKALPPRIVVSYADLSQDHDGGVYRALSFNFAGASKPRSEWRLPGSSRNSGKVPGAVRAEVPPRMRFWTTTGSKRERTYLRTICSWPSY